MTRSRNREILARMPAYLGSNLIDRVKPAATLLARSDRPLEQANITRARLARKPIPAPSHIPTPRWQSRVPGDLRLPELWPRPDLLHVARLDLGLGPRDREALG